MWHVWGRGEVDTGLWLGNLRERERLEDPGVDGILKWMFRKWDGETRDELIRLRIGTGCGHL